MLYIYIYKYAIGLTSMDLMAMKCHAVHRHVFQRMQQSQMDLLHMLKLTYKPAQSLLDNINMSSGPASRKFVFADHWVNKHFWHILSPIRHAACHTVQTGSMTGSLAYVLSAHDRQEDTQASLQICQKFSSVRVQGARFLKQT